MRDGGVETVLDPQMAAALARFDELGRALARPAKPTRADVRRFDLEQRRWFNGEAPALERVEDDFIRGPFRPVRVRRYRPDSVAAAAIVYFHGGGWFSCSNDTHDRIMRLLARYSGANVIGVDYCLAPEHRFPRAVDEANAVLNWIARHGGDWNLDVTRLAFGGCSAGANIALGTVLALDREVLRHYRAGALFYGPYDPALDSESCRRFGTDGAYLSVAEMAWCWNTYLADDSQRRDFRAAPLCADEAALATLPPLYLCAAGLDPLRDDTLRLAARLEQAAVPHVLSVRHGLTHSFLGFTRMVDEAGRALQDAGGFLAERLRETMS